MKKQDVIDTINSLIREDNLLDIGIVLADSTYLTMHKKKALNTSVLVMTAT